MGIEIFHQCTVNPKEYGYNRNCRVTYVHVKVTDLKKRVQTITQDFLDKSWINKLDFATKIAFETRANETISRLIENILEKVENTLTKELGEIVVSSSARDILCTHHQHTKIPLAELWKEKVAGNPGFDFHTETPTEFIAFGEAKYRNDSNSYGCAMEQIDKFITNGKDKKELSDLQHFVSKKALSNMGNLELRVFIAAFSIHDTDDKRILNNVMKNAHMENLLRYPELYIIGVEA